MKPQIICDIDGVLAEFVDLTGSSEEEVWYALDKIPPVTPNPEASLGKLRKKYSLTFATARKHPEAVESTLHFMWKNSFYTEDFDNLIVGTTTTTKPLLIPAMRAKFIIDDHPKVIDLTHKLGYARWCVPVYIKRGRGTSGFPYEAENLVEAADMILSEEFPATKDWGDYSKALNDLHSDEACVVPV